MRNRFWLLSLLIIIAHSAFATQKHAGTQLNLGSYARTLNITDAQVCSIVSKMEKLRDHQVHPAWSLSAPTGFASSWGSLSMGAAIEAPDSAYGHVLVPLASSLGYGDPSHIIGGSIYGSVAAINPNTAKGSFGTGTTGVSVGHTFGHLGVKAGAENIIAWGFGSKIETAYYAAMSYCTELSRKQLIALVGTAGIGNQRFTGDFYSTRATHVMGFFSVALQRKNVSLVVDYTSKVLSTGISLVPSYKVPIVMSAGVYDLTHHLPGNRTSFFATASYQWFFS